MTFCKMGTLKNLSEQGVKPIIPSDRILYRAVSRRSGIGPGTFFAIRATDDEYKCLFGILALRKESIVLPQVAI